MEDLARAVMDNALKLGAQYADIRMEQTRGEGFLLENGNVEHIASDLMVGAGIRVLAEGAWGFYATTRLDRKSLFDAAKRAYKMAASSSQRVSEPTKLAPVKAVQDSYVIKVKKKMEDFPLEKRVQLAKDCNSSIRDASKRIHRAAISISGDTKEKLFCSSEGALIKHDTMKCYLSIRAIAHEAGVTQDQSTLEGGAGGFEVIEKKDPTKLARDLAKKTAELLAAPMAPTEEMTVIMDQDFVSLLSHEIVGHPSEADRVLGKEAAWAGVAWWKGMIGQRVGSDLFNASDDPQIDGALGYYKYDDEGVPATEKVLIKDGILVGHMHSRETAAIFGVEPNGGMRATSSQFVPLIRMSNTFVKPGDWTFEEMIRDVKRGIYVVGQKIPSIDNRRYNWQISCMWGYMIEKGELTTLLRDVTVAGTAPVFFKSIDAVGKDLELRPVPNCGKGDPMQLMYMGNGGPHIRGKAQVIGARGR